MKKENKKLILDGNALYEIDFECKKMKEKALQEQHRRETEKCGQKGKCQK